MRAQPRRTQSVYLLLLPRFLKDVLQLLQIRRENGRKSLVDQRKKFFAIYSNYFYSRKCAEHLHERSSLATPVHRRTVWKERGREFDVMPIRIKPSFAVR
jgi:hypothetical protein